MSKKAQVAVTKKHRFGMLPQDVMQREDITAAEKLLLMAMNMESFGSGVVLASDGLLAGLCGISRARAVGMRKSLESTGLISRFGNPHQQVQAYRLLHPDMAGDSQAIPETPTTLRQPRLRPNIKPCTKCTRACVPSKADGWCRTCIRDAKLRGIVRSELRRFDRAAGAD